ncbi:MAG: efflux RND transporter periplasmic adaptor subunit [Gemmataceae bacterium]|nr:efflux RND transporter periplasmic adaptor subunit [Gemmataceae bacterium]
MIIWRLSAVLGLSALFLGSGCWEKAKEGAKPAEAKVAEVKLVKVSKRSLVRAITQPAQVLPFEEAILHAKVTGYVKQVLADIGDEVKGPVFGPMGKVMTPGTALLRIDAPEILQDWRQKKAMEKLAEEELALKRDMEKVSAAAIESAQAGLEETRAGILRVDAAFLRWKTEYDRISKLVSGKVLDEQTGDEALNQFKSAESSKEEMAARVKQAQARLDKARAEMAQAKGETRVAAAKILVAEAEAKKSEALVAYTILETPFDGVITSRKVDPGKLVHEDSANKGEPLFTISKIDPVRLVIEVPEIDSPLVNAGAQVQVSLHALPGKEITGKVSRISWALDQSSRTLRAEVDLENPQREVRPGMFATARILAPLPEALVLPVAALVRSPEGSFAFTVEGGKAKRVELRLGRVEGDFAQVTGIRLEAGGEWQAAPQDLEFIASGAASLAPGQPVLVK